MRTIHIPLVLLGLAVTIAAHLGCTDTWDELYRPLTDPKLETSSTSSGTGGGNPACEGDPTQDPRLVRDDCGVFVSATAAPGGDGTKDSPLQSFGAAAAMGAKRVYACSGMYTETAPVSFSGGVELYGGFTDCTANWTWSSSASAQVTTAADVPGVVLAGGANHVENVSVTAPAATMMGGSSIAMVVNGGSLAMVNGALTAGDAKDGEAGVTVPDDATLDGDTGDSGKSTCDAGLHAGPMGKTKTCATGGSSTAGNGGDGGQIMSMMLQPAGNGTDGLASPAVGQPPDGQGGLGEGQTDPMTMMPVASCKIGQPGANGTAGNSGDGAAGIGSISASGYVGALGKDGANGTPGQGGGGGGGAKGGKSIDCGMGLTDVFGASGGAGGTGGCGGALGGGGKPGGSSIALLVLDAQVTLTSVTLTAGLGGKGGTGGNGQSGGQKGNGGGPGAGKGTAQASCRGGDGGQGGPGGPGGGGQGGHSLGIAFKGTKAKAPMGGTFKIDMTKNGKGGDGGANNTAANAGKGADGVAGNCWDFMTNVACK